MGPLRVWPGGLAMGRTIGDASAGSVATCEPEIRQVGIRQTSKNAVQSRVVTCGNMCFTGPTGIRIGKSIMQEYWQLPTAQTSQPQSSCDRAAAALRVCLCLA